MCNANSKFIIGNFIFITTTDIIPNDQKPAAIAKPKPKGAAKAKPKASPKAKLKGNSKGKGKGKKGKSGSRSRKGKGKGQDRPRTPSVPAKALTAKQKKKTLCSFFAAGYCMHGEACQFKHPGVQMNRSPSVPAAPQAESSAERKKRLLTSDPLPIPSPAKPGERFGYSLNTS